MTYSNDEILAAVERYDNTDSIDQRAHEMATFARTALTELLDRIDELDLKLVEAIADSDEKANKQADEIARLDAEVVRLLWLIDNRPLI